MFSKKKKEAKGIHGLLSFLIQSGEVTVSNTMFGASDVRRIRVSQSAAAENPQQAVILLEQCLKREIRQSMDILAERVAAAGKPVTVESVACKLFSPWTLQKTILVYFGQSGLKIISPVSEHALAMTAMAEEKTVNKKIRKGNSGVVVTKKMIEQIKDRAAEEALSSGFDVYVGTRPGDCVIIEKTITTCWLNGYKIKNVEGRRGQWFAAAVSVSIAPRWVITHIEEAVGRHFGNFHISAGHALTDPSLLINSFPEDCTITWISGETTDLVRISEGFPVATYSFPVGIDHVVRALMQKQHISYEAAVSSITMVSLIKKDHIKIESARAWLGQYSRALEELYKDTLRPKTSLVFCLDGAEKFFKDILPGSDIKKHPFLPLF